jgi:hypothetical protein
MGARVYNPYTGTFTQPDPIQGGGANAYGYTDGDPVNETDLSGMCLIFSCSTYHAVGHAISSAASATGEFVVHNYGTIAEVAAGTGCLVASGGVCAGLLIGGLITDTAQNAASGHFSTGRLALDVVGAIPGGEGAGLEMLANRGGSLARAIGDAKALAPVRRLGAAVGLGTEGVKKVVRQ